MSPNQVIVLRVIESAREPEAFPSDPLASALGARLVAADRARGTAHLEFTPGQTFLQGEGVVQGGAVTSMLDFAAACAAMAVLEPGARCATVSLTTSFLRPVLAGTCLVIGVVERRARTLVFARASLTEPGENGRTLASAVAVMAVQPPDGALS